MIDLTLYDIFNKNLSTLKKTSRDTSTKPYSYMTESLLQVVDFDKSKNQYASTQKMRDCPKSVDAVFQQTDGKIVFVEFKNGYIDRTVEYEIKQKIYDSVLIFCDVVSMDVGTFRQSAEFILVYNEEDNQSAEENKKSTVQFSKSYVDIVSKLGKLANKETVLWKLDFFENYCFSKLHTYNKAEFKQYTDGL